MTALAWIKIAGAAGVALALAALVWLAQDRFDQKALADKAARCAVASEANEKPLMDCLPQVRARIEDARRSRACDAALLPALRPETRFAALMSCEAGTKRLIAQADVDAARIAGLTAELAHIRADTGDAVARAEERGKAAQPRRDYARQLIENGARDGGDRIACDAECLRRLGN